MQNRALRVGPVALTTNTEVSILNTTLSNGANGTAGISNPSNIAVYAILTHIRLVNVNSSACTASLYIGSAAGNSNTTAFAFNGYAVAGNSYVDWYGRLRLDAADYLTGGANANSSIILQAEGEIGIV